MTGLRREIAEIIAAEGPIGIDRYMALALSHPVHGYYRVRDPLGQEGDFTTAPEISQMFGELLGLWAAVVWTRMGRPQPVRLVEFGPGRGTLMADAMRAARIVPGFVEAARLHLVETSPVLRERQRGALGTAPVAVAWHETWRDVPGGPAILLMNEFLDALPIRQFVRTPTGWHERLVGLGPDGGLSYGLASRPDPRREEPSGRPGDVREVGEAALALVGEIAARLVRDGGAALMLDYGPAGAAMGDTFQAVRGHRAADPLAEPGEADLTAHVRFADLATEARRQGACVHGPVEQGVFLEALGIRERAARLAAGADPAGRERVETALRRLVGRGPSAMGSLFKALAIADPALGELPGFASDRDPDGTPARPTPRPTSQARSPC